MMKSGNRGSMVMAGVLGVGMAVSSIGADVPAVTSAFDVNLYGYVKLDAAYDSQRTQNGNLMFFVLPEGADGKQDEFNMTARETRLGLNFTVPEIDGILVTGRTEIDFYSGTSENSPNPRLRLAYVDVASGGWSLRAGQDWETFITVLPKILNFSTMADAGALGLRRPQVRLTHALPLGEKTKLTSKLAVARTIGQDIDAGGQEDGSAAGMPTAQANLALETTGINGRRIVMSVSGHAGIEEVAAYVDNTNADTPVTMAEEDYSTWSVIGSLVVPLADWMALQGTIWTGENLDTYYGGVGQGINKQQAAGIAAQGGWAQVVLNPTKNLNVNLGYGVDEPEGDDLNAGNRSKNELIFANVFYSVNRAVTLATEVSHMNTSYKDAASASNNRVQGSLIFRF